MDTSAKHIYKYKSIIVVAAKKIVLANLEG
jgi:hypothetical protein